jgi:hypothetical protein
MTGGDAMTGREAERRAEFRAFVRANHPDRGGDPDVFAAGLRAWRRSAVPDLGGNDSVTVYRRPTVPEACARWVRVCWENTRWGKSRRTPRVR